MQRLAALFMVISAACTSGTATGSASLTGVAVKAAAVETFEDVDAGGTKVMGWNILLYEQAPGGDCLEGTILAKVAIYTNQAVGSAPQALLQTGGISIVVDKPPMVLSNAAANMTAEGVGSITGLVNIDEFHLTPDAKHADNIKGSISAGGFDSAEAGVSLSGSFDAPICTED
jgi:hypothetical protein